MSSYRNLVMIVLALLLVGGGLAIWNASKDKTEQTQVTTTQTPDDGSGATGKNASFTITEGELKKWKMEAENAAYSDTQGESGRSITAQLTNVKGEFYDKNGKVILNFSAPKGSYASKGHEVSLEGGVVAKSTDKDGGELRAPKMSWNIKSTQVLAVGGVQMIFPMGKSTARTCRFTLDFSNISLEGGVTSEITSAK